LYVFENKGQTLAKFIAGSRERKKEGVTMRRAGMMIERHGGG
jgi:hypothetical protein